MVMIIYIMMRGVCVIVCMFVCVYKYADVSVCNAF